MTAPFIGDRTRSIGWGRPHINIMLTTAVCSTAFALQGGQRIVAPSARTSMVTMSAFDDIVAKLPAPIKDLLAGPPPDPDSVPPRNVVITGGANGVGYAYADSFMKRARS